MTNGAEQSFIAQIHELDKKGAGQAVVWHGHDGKQKKLKIIVPSTLPGEKVRVVVDEPKRRWANARLEEVIEPHLERLDPPCPHFDRCGGCVWQHWRYEGQLRHKTEQVKALLAQHGFDPGVVRETIGMEHPWHYRNKMEFTFSPEGLLGLHEQGNFRQVISLETCLIAGEKIVKAAMEVARWARDHQLPGYHKDTHEGLLRHVMVRESFATGEVMVALFATEAPEGALKEAAADLAERITKALPDVKSLLWLENRAWADRTQAEQTHVLAGRDFIYDELCGFRYRLWFDTFFQTNPVQAAKLVELALEMGEPQPHEKMIDLFCGVGTFSLPFAKQVKALAGIEIVETSIESAKRNAKDNGIDNTYFLARDARRGIDEVLEQFGRPELLLLDPPRSGAGGKVMRKIGRAQPERVVYVSCNPETFVADIAELAPFGYVLKTVQPVDMFPHTAHVECCALLVKST